MKREDIEKAKSNYVKELCDAKKLANGASVDIACNAFVAGADWRINSVWHDTNSVPKQLSDILIFNIYGGIEINHTGFFSNWEQYIEFYHISKWAYIEDLLSTKENK